MNLKTRYIGLELRTPVIVGSCDLTSTVEGMKSLESYGAGALVLPSVFEEEIMYETDANRAMSVYGGYGDKDELSQLSKEHKLEKYLQLISDAKKQVNIPIIASINCMSSREWVAYAKKIQTAGADALELCMYILPNDTKYHGDEIEKIYHEIIKKIYTYVTIPVSLKIGYYFSGLANMVLNLSKLNISGFVLFNGNLLKDIDIEKIEYTGNEFVSSHEEFLITLKWISVLSSKVNSDLCASAGVHDGESVIKNILAGAKAVQVVSSLYTNGNQHIRTMLNTVENWMKNHNFEDISSFCGKLCVKENKKPIIYERVEFLKFANGKR